MREVLDIIFPLLHIFFDDFFAFLTKSSTFAAIKEIPDDTFRQYPSIAQNAPDVHSHIG